MLPEFQQEENPWGLALKEKPWKTIVSQMLLGPLNVLDFKSRKAQREGFMHDKTREISRRHVAARKLLR